jgi:hypothetical protein
VTVNYRKKWLGLAAALSLFGAAGAIAGAQPLEFRSPTPDDPRYLITATLEVKGKAFRFIGADLPKGSPYRAVSILKNGKPADTAKNLDPGIYEISLRYAWRSNVEYRADLHFIEGESETPKTIEMKGTAPASGGIPALAQEGFSDAFRISEDAGIERKGEVVYLTVTAPKSEIDSSDFVVFEGSARLPHQVVETKESIPPESQAKTHPVTMTKKLAVAVDAAPRGQKLVRVFKSAPGAVSTASNTAFVLSGDGLGKTVKGADYALQFHPQSGQIFTIESFAAGIKLFNKAGVIHWNPDVFTPGIAWDHSFDWNPPLSFAETNGPLLYLNARSGPMPRIKDVFLEVKYTLEKGAPHFLAETRMRVDKDLGVIALRNDEMVLYKELFDTLVYKGRDGEIVQKPLKERPGSPYGLAHIAPSDPAWVGLIKADSGYGFFSLRLESSVANLGLGGDFSHRAGTYFYAPSDGDYVYWVRPWLYTWGEFATGNLLTSLPAGSVFTEKNAYLLVRWDGKAAAASLDALVLRLKNPLKVF